MGKWAPDNDAGEHAYVVESRQPGFRTYTFVVYAASLAEARRDHGSTGQLHTFRKVRRATAEDVA